MGLIDKPISRAVKAAGFTGLALGLLGCAAQDVAAPDKVDTTQATTETPAENTAEFSTDGKPTKTIETPWGPREIYDPVQDRDISKIFEKWYNENQYSYRDYEQANSSDFRRVVTSQSIFSLDMKRLGCVDIITPNGVPEEWNTYRNFQDSYYFFEEDCKSEHIFGRSKLSSCELNNRTIRTPDVRWVGKRYIHNKTADYIAESQAKA